MTLTGGILSIDPIFVSSAFRMMAGQHPFAIASRTVHVDADTDFGELFSEVNAPTVLILRDRDGNLLHTIEVKP